MLYHEPVLLKEVIKYLDSRLNQNFVDCTVGNGGHTLEIIKRLGSKGKILGIDLDIKAIKLVESRIKNSEIKNRIILVQDNFKNLNKIIQKYKFHPVSGILLDLGISSSELQDRERGFSFQIDGPLDMRYKKDGLGGKGRLGGEEGNLTAGEIVNQWPERELERIFREYGEERYSKQIASEIVKARKEKKIETTFSLVNIIEKIYRSKPKPKIHFATKVFQALRIAVNDELNNLKEVLPQAIEVLEPGGRLVVISFHSLEDRIVKNFFRKEAHGCICPPELPICKCGHKPRIKIITKKPIRPSLEEIKNNSRSRSAKMRVVEKLKN